MILCGLFTFDVFMSVRWSPVLQMTLQRCIDVITGSFSSKFLPAALAAGSLI